MVDARDMSPEEAQAYLSKIQKKTRQRQRDYVKRKEQEGQRRINTFLNAEATEILDREQQKGKKVGDVLSDALIFYARHKVRQTAEKAHNKPILRRIDDSDVSGDVIGDTDGHDPKIAGKRIIELSDEGLNLTEIVNQLEAEGISTATGKKQWQRTTVSRIIKRLKGAESRNTGQSE